jgi:chromosome partitioning protein
MGIQYHNDPVMRVLSFVTQKGGSGKTTLVFCCAVAAEDQGKRVLILDMDPQGTATAWYKDREAERPALATIKSTELSEAITKAKNSGFAFLFIDTPGRDEPGTTAAIRASDLCIIPCRPTPGDMKATPPTIATINRLERNAAFVLMQTPPRGQRNTEAERGLSMLGMVCPHHIVMRHAYQDAQGRGLGVTEFEPEGKAAEEIRQLWKWISKKLGKIQ